MSEEQDHTKVTDHSTSLEQRNTLDVSRVREHIHHAGAVQAISVRAHQLRRVAREGCGVAAHIDDATRAQAADAPHHFERARARRVEQDLVEGLRGPRPHGVFVAQIGGVEFGIDDRIRARVVARPRDELGVALHAHHVRGAARDGQGEVAEAAEEIEHAFVSLRIQ